MKKTLLALALGLSATAAVAQETVITQKFGGQIDVEIFGDSNANFESRNGLQLIAPARPNISTAGDELTAQGRLRMSASPTRFYYSMTATNVIKATVKGYIEVDFMGINEAVFNSLRMRHVYIDMKWSQNSLLLGQTSHLTMPDGIAASTVTYGGGYPFHPLNRIPQVQFRHNIGEYSNLTVAAGMFSGALGEQQSYAMVPDLQVRYVAGNAALFTYGAVAGVRSIQPRIETAEGHVAKATLITFNAGAFGRYKFADGCAVRVFGLWGQDLSGISILGGYGPLKSEQNKDDYGYTPVEAVSTYIDIESGISKTGWQYGIFAGLQKSLGSPEEMILSSATISNRGLDNFWRVAPRVLYHYEKNLSLGLEYLISGAQWASTLDDNYKPVTSTYANNSRVTFLARYRF